MKLTEGKIRLNLCTIENTTSGVIIVFGTRKTGLQKYEEILNTLRNGGTYHWIDWKLNHVDMEWLEIVYNGLQEKGWSTYGGSGYIDKIFDKCKFPHSGYHMGSIVFLNKDIEQQVRAKLR